MNPACLTMCHFRITDHASAELASGGSRSLTPSFPFEVTVMIRLHRGVIKDNLQCFISTDPPFVHISGTDIFTWNRMLPDV